MQNILTGNHEDVGNLKPQNMPLDEEGRPLGDVEGHRWPLVQTLDYDSYYHGLRDYLGVDWGGFYWGISFRIQGDVTMGYNMPVSSREDGGRTNFVVNPYVFGEAGMRNHVKFSLGPVVWKVKFNWLLAQLKFADIDLMVSQRPGGSSDLDWCMGVKYALKLFDFKTKLATSVWTCQYPMYGRMICDYDDCLWMLYELSQPLMNIKSIFSVLYLLDLSGDYFPWTCNYDYYAEQAVYAEEPLAHEGSGQYLAQEADNVLNENRGYESEYFAEPDSGQDYWDSDPNSYWDS